MPHNRIAAVATWDSQVSQSPSVPNGFVVIPAVLVVQSSQPADWQLDLYRRAREQAEAALRPRNARLADLFAVMN
ncbi:MAG: hypothetical protein U0836_16375 [Pirellulales bacterium]|mgnify:CR=1 FL=1